MKNVTTRNVSCSLARSFAKGSGFWGYGTYHRRLGVFNCHTRIPNPRSSWIDIRCTSSWGRVIRWQYLSGE